MLRRVTLILIIILFTVVTIMFYSLTKNHYIGPLHSCLMAKICNHTGIEICGLEKGNRDTRSFLDDCDMFEYNCDYKKAYSQVNDELCRENMIETSTGNLTTTISDVRESTSVNYSSTTTTLETHTTSGVTSQQTTTIEPQIVTTPTESLTSVSGNTDGKCTCMPTSKSSKSGTELSSIKTTIDKTSETTLNFTETTTAARTSESAHVTESINGSTYANGSKIPITTECTRIITKPTRIIDKTTDTVISDITKSCTCMHTEMPTSKIIPMTTRSETRHDKCTCMDFQTNSVTSTTESTTTLSQSLTTTTSTTTLTTTDVDTTLKRNSCDKYPKHCDRPHKWETTARGETRDFFQILKERFGDRVKILKDTTHWPRRMKYL